MKQYTNTRTWIVTKTETDSHSIGNANTVFTTANGYLSLKGSLLEDRSGTYPTTILAGVFDVADMIAFIRPTKHERRYLDPEFFDDAKPSPSVANLPDPLFIQVFVEGVELSFRRGNIDSFAQHYDMRTGLYTYEYILEQPNGRKTKISASRFADMSRVHTVAMRYSVTPINYSGRITIRSGIDGSVRSNLQKDRQFDVLEASGDDGKCFVHAKTLARGIDVNILVETVMQNPLRTVVEHERVYSVFETNAEEGRTVTIDKHIAISSSEDVRHGVECDIQTELEESVSLGFDSALKRQEAAWRELWDRCDVQIEGDDLVQLYLRFCLFHLLSAAPRHTDKLTVPCKLLSGEHYQGTVFYDTDLYIEPFYLFTLPQVARHCLNYRWHGLKHGREIAKLLGYKGAKFAWQSGPYGEECLGRWWRFTHTNIHIDSDVAYSLMQYWLATGDTDFMAERGIDMLVESSRFYTSRAVLNSATGQYDLVNVSGPDEGHCESTNNFYTNLLAQKTLVWTNEMLETLRKIRPADFDSAISRLSIKEQEMNEWQKVADGLTFYFDTKTKIYEQCEGFHQLKPAPADLLEGRTAWFATVFPYQALNQPDVVMGMVLLRDEFKEDIMRANWDFYKDKSMNFSSMSFVINSIMAKEMGEMENAYRDFLISAGEDLDDELTGRRDTADGIHGTASGGAWMAAVFGFGGVRLSEQGLAINPRLPKHWKSLKFNLALQNALLSFEVTQNTVSVNVDADKATEISATIAGKPVILGTGEPSTFDIGD